MTSPLLALFTRSIRQDVRVKMTYIARVGLVVVILLFLLTFRESGAGNAPGLRFFGTVIFINAVFVMLASFSYFASAITEEKEEMTLGLLRMTNLNPLSILLGKSTSRLFGALLLLLAQFPFTLLAVSLGGVSLGQIFAAYVTLGAFIFFVANLALLASVICQRSRGAAVLTGLTLFTAFWGIPLAARLLGFLAQAMGQPSAWISALREIAEWLDRVSPFDRLGVILRTGFAESPWSAQVWSNLAMGVGCFLIAWGAFEFFCDEKEPTAARGFLARRTSRLRLFGAGRVWKSALAWKDFHFLVGGRLWIVLKLLAYSLIVAGIFYTVRKVLGATEANRTTMGFVALYISIIAICAELAFSAAGLFAQERRWKTLSSLAMLPMSMRQIAYQKIRGTLCALLPAALCSAFACFLLKDDIFREGRAWHIISSDALGGFSYVGLQGIFFLHLIVLLSLYVGRGALPAASAVQFVLNLFVTMVFASVSGDGSSLWVGFSLITFVGIALLHRAIGLRLEDLAAEE
ncbi:MAG TPA: hypothetical protein VF593_04010 [Chthoniobacteraceae bacterium]|jgi:hypothetical protein